MRKELQTCGLHVETEVRLPINYKGAQLQSKLKVDLIVESLVIVELKAVDALCAIHSAQVITYLKLTGCPAGLLINFNEILLKNGLRRLDRPDLYSRKGMNS